MGFRHEDLAALFLPCKRDANVLGDAWFPPAAPSRRLWAAVRCRSIVQRASSLALGPRACLGQGKVREPRNTGFLRLICNIDFALTSD